MIGFACRVTPQPCLPHAHVIVSTIGSSSPSASLPSLTSRPPPVALASAVTPRRQATCTMRQLEP
jgi:hypothetical protein